MKLSIRVPAFLLPLLILLGLSAPVAAQSNLNVVGSSTMHPLVSALARRFEALHPGVTVTVESGGSQRGIDGARTGKADIGMASRTLTEAEKDLIGFAIARDGVGFVVHTENPIGGLTTTQLRDIYTGRITNWRQAGGADAPLTAISREKGRSSLELFLHYFELKDEDLKATVTAGDNALIVDAVTADPWSIAYLSIGEVERQAGAGRPIRLLTVDGTAATARNVRRGDYPILRQLTLVTRELPQDMTKRFIDFCLSSQATGTVREYDFVPYVD